MAKKYNKITEEDVLRLFAGKEIITRKEICKQLNCSLYSTRQITEDLRDRGILRLHRHGYIKQLKHN